jgi:hypothetical protein
MLVVIHGLHAASNNIEVAIKTLNDQLASSNAPSRRWWRAGTATPRRPTTRQKQWRPAPLN